MKIQGEPEKKMEVYLFTSTHLHTLTDDMRKGKELFNKLRAEKHHEHQPPCFYRKSLGLTGLTPGTWSLSRSKQEIT